MEKLQCVFMHLLQITFIRVFLLSLILKEDFTTKNGPALRQHPYNFRFDTKVVGIADLLSWVSGFT